MITNKEKQGYIPDPIHKICRNCYHYSETGKYTGPFGNEVVICDLGEFEVKKTATCARFTEAVE